MIILGNQQVIDYARKSIIANVMNKFLDVFRDQPLIYAALIIGMLVEFPNLAVLKHLMLRTERSVPAAPILNPDS